MGTRIDQSQQTARAPGTGPELAGRQGLRALRSAQITSHPAQVTPRTGKDIVADAWRAFASLDPARIAASLTPNAQWLAPEGNATAVALDSTHQMIGRDAIVHFLTVEFPNLFVADVSVEFLSVHSDGQTVIVEKRMRATLANGQRYDNAYCFIFALEGERIMLVREYMDTKRGWACIFGEGARASC